MEGKKIEEIYMQKMASGVKREMSCLKKKKKKDIGSTQSFRDGRWGFSREKVSCSCWQFCPAGATFGKT